MSLSADASTENGHNSCGPDGNDGGGNNSSNNRIGNRIRKRSNEIVPIRVDAISEDKTIRIVETLLFDPTCWPVTHTLHQPFYAFVEENISQMAHTIISDAEVQGMGRTIRHFTGRIDLWSPKLQKAVEDQLRPQLWNIATTMGQDNFATTPKKDGKTQDETLMPISIRLVIDRIVIHEDILWDKHGPVSPFEFAQDMAEELNLPEEATVAIATTMVEQLHGLTIDTTPDPTLAESEKSLRGAWLMDSKEQASIASQVVALHRTI